MLMEKINYPDGNPVKIEFISVKEYPLHTHNDLEIIYVLEGDIDLQLSYYTYHLSEKDIHIVNTKDIHGIYSKNKASLLLILYVNMDYFERYHPDLKKIIFFCGEYYNHHNYTKVKRIT
ncbi:MAG: AraC family ligand binding domain-containing protein, partial [Clostridia bacterium]|nr:AraC family ligand binding domain-containing protein [Clostridia bacterium]